MTTRWWKEHSLTKLWRTLREPGVPESPYEYTQEYRVAAGSLHRLCRCWLDDVSMDNDRFRRESAIITSSLRRPIPDSLWDQHRDLLAAATDEYLLALVELAAVSGAIWELEKTNIVASDSTSVLVRRNAAYRRHMPLTFLQRKQALSPSTRMEFPEQN